VLLFGSASSGAAAGYVGFYCWLEHAYYRSDAFGSGLGSSMAVGALWVGADSK
jgi:hypothetical protein